MNDAGRPAANGMGGRRTSLAALAAIAVLHAGLVRAQNETEPAFTAPPGSAQAIPAPVYSSPLPANAAQVSQDAVEIFRRTCLASVGDPAALVDAAINAGLAPYAGGSGSEASAASLLGDTPGQVFAPAGSTDLLLAIGDDGRCTVWAARADGPAVKQAFVAAIDSLGPDTQVRPARDRKIQRAGAWRHQLGYDIAGARSFSADAVTLLAAQPGLQVLRAAPSSARPSASDNRSGRLPPNDGALQPLR